MASFSIVDGLQLGDSFTPSSPMPLSFIVTDSLTVADIVTPQMKLMFVSQRLTFQQSTRSVSPAVMSGIPNAFPVNFARAITGDVYFTNGLIPMMKWDGIRFTAQTVGVPPPTQAIIVGAAPFLTGFAALGTKHLEDFTTPAFAEIALKIAADGILSSELPLNASFSGQTEILESALTGTFTGAGNPLSVLGKMGGGWSGNLSGTIPANQPLGTGYGGMLFGVLTGIGVGTFHGVIVALLPSGATPTLDTLPSTTPILGTFTGTITGYGWTAGIGGGPGSGTISGTYTAYERFLDVDGNPSNLSPVSNEIVVQNIATIYYSSVQVPTDPKVVRRQILRNTTGQAVTYYVDVDTTDLSATTFTSTQDDETLQTNEAVPLFDSNGSSLANRFTVPPTHKPVIVSYLDRMFAAGNVVYQEGCAEVTNGSATVNGVGTQWTTALEGRFFYAVGGGTSYQIQTVDPQAQTLTLTGAYQEGTDPFCVYVIQPPPAERNLIYFSEPGTPEAWPVTNALANEVTGDDETAMMSADSFLYVFQRQRSWRLSYHQGPEIDGAIFPAERRGCINQRSWVSIDGAGYVLDQQGVYKFDAGGGTEGLSAAIQDIFMLSRDGDGLKINWNASRWFHASHSPDERTIRWFVALSGARLPYSAICWNYDSKFWWIEDFAFPVGASALMDYPLSRPLLAGASRRVFAQGFGTLDGPDPKAGTTRAMVYSGLVDGFNGPTSLYPSSGVVGSPVAIYDGRGKGQVNIVSSVGGVEIRCVQPWLIQPDYTSKFQLGGFTWTWQSGLYRWLNEEGNEERRAELVFPPTNAQCDLRFYREFSETAEKYGYTWPTTQAEIDSVRITDDSSDAVIDLSFTAGFAQVRRSGRRERYIQKADVFSIELAGVSAEEPVVLYEINIDGAE